MFKVLCSITNSFCAAANSTVKSTTSLTVANEASTSTESGTSAVVDASEANKNTKYFSELKVLYILGKHYPQPISKL